MFLISFFNDATNNKYGNDDSHSSRSVGRAVSSDSHLCNKQPQITTNKLLVCCRNEAEARYCVTQLHSFPVSS